MLSVQRFSTGASIQESDENCTSYDHFYDCSRKRNILPLYRVAQKFDTFLYASLTSSDIDQFSNFFHWDNHEKICNSTITEDSITLQTSLHYLTKCQCLKATTENKTTSVTTHFQSASSTSKADILNIWCNSCKVTLDNNWDNKHVTSCC